jgi:nucleoside-diphosphate-sugar epimerase
VADVVEAYLKVATTSTSDYGAVFNVGAGVQVTLREIVEVARRCLSIPGEPQWGSMPARAWDSTCWVADARRIRAELGWAPQFGLEAGFRAFAQWYQADPQWRATYEKPA